ncbi:NAD(P)-dependent oxidoreductase [Marinomonas agarivorans]|nr:NAD(P)-dependent oxidoreductase [Marinomonas agarivorans]
MEQTIGIIGLGSIGRNLATTLIRNQFTVLGFDLSAQSKAHAMALGVTVTKKIVNLAKSCHVIILSLPTAKEVEQVCLGSTGLSALLPKGAIVIDTTTSTPQTSRKVATQLQLSGVEFLDAPISGGPASAAAGTVSMMIGGKASTYQKALPILNAISYANILIGKTGAGNIAKTINNMLAATHLITTSEALALAQKADIDPRRVLEAINLGSGRSGASQSMFPAWVQSHRQNSAPNSGCSMGVIRNDVANAKALAKQLRIKLPVATQAAKCWEVSSSKFTDNDDLCCIVKYTNHTLLRNEN